MAATHTAWASVDTVHDGSDTYLARCADLVTPALEREASRLALAEWQAMRAERLVNLKLARRGRRWLVSRLRRY